MTDQELLDRYNFYKDAQMQVMVEGEAYWNITLADLIRLTKLVQADV